MIFNFETKQDLDIQKKFLKDGYIISNFQNKNEVNKIQEFIVNIIKKKIDVGLPLDESVGIEFQESVKHKNFIFSNGVNLIHEFFNIERKIKNNLLSKTVQKLSNYPPINKIFTKIADRGVFF